MTYEIIPGNAFCYLRDGSHINDVPIDYEDFVNKYDHDRGSAEPYGCGDMRADVIPSTPEVLKKYGITEEEYQLVAFEIAEALHFGRCGWCV